MNSATGSEFRSTGLVPGRLLESVIIQTDVVESAIITGRPFPEQKRTDQLE